MELVTWRGTPGVGDFMWALNCAHNHAWTVKTKVNLEFQWNHDENYLHHFEDPETIIERLDYIHNFYHRKDDVHVSHVFNAYGRYRDWKYEDDLKMQDGRLRQVAIDRPNKNRFWFQSERFQDTKDSRIPFSDWGFRKDCWKKTDKRKVVIWRPLFNAEIPRTWKRELTNDHWDDIINSLSAAGLYTVELTYRTPVSEAFYHISTCRQVICYDGMWHYIARNFHKPIMVASKEGVTKYHTPQCYRIHKDMYPNEENLSLCLGFSKKQAVDYEEKCRQFYQDR